MMIQKSTGKISNVVTERGTRVVTRFAIVDGLALITSHDTLLRVNDFYPRALQPRDRSRIASDDQIGRLSQKLNPELLGDSVSASAGAPIIGSDGVVESGNARVLALLRCYAAMLPITVTGIGMKGVEYLRWLTVNAEAFGCLGVPVNGDGEPLFDSTCPILVRVRETEVDRARWCVEANEQSVAAMSATEQAHSDAQRLDASMLAEFFPNDEGDIITAANRKFVRGFMERVVAPSERGRYTDADGWLSTDGVRRIKNAVLAKAYGDTDAGAQAIERLAESTDDNVRRISTALLHKAGRFAVLKQAIADGARFPLDISGDLAATMRKLSHLREIEQSVGDYLNQGALFGADLSELQQKILVVFEQNKLSSTRINEVLENYLRSVEAAGDPRQAAIFETEKFTREELFDAAVRRAVLGEGGDQSDLFSAPVAPVKTVASLPPQIVAVQTPRAGVKVTGEVSEGYESQWRSSAAKRAWVTIRAKRAAALAAQVAKQTSKPKQKKGRAA